MMRHLTLIALSLSANLFAASGGPDMYGYTWKDSNEPGGPVFSWIDITTTGTQVQGLADDNMVGPFVMATSQAYYWYTRKNVWIGSNGYIAFANGNIASPFPTIPMAGGMNDYIAAYTADLTFSGTGNPGRCYILDDDDQTIISYVGVPFWSPTAPSYTGSNTFQVILNKTDNTITVQYLLVSGTTQNNDLLIGIESVAGSIGLQHSVDQYQTNNFAIRYYRPDTTELDIVDAMVDYNTAPGSHGRFIARNGAPLNLEAGIINSGNVDLTDIEVQATVRNQANMTLVTASAQVAALVATNNAPIDFNAQFVPTTAGTHTLTTSISGIANELVSTNNSKVQELVVVDTTQTTLQLTYAGSTDDGTGLGWNGGDGGVGVFFAPPYYPAYAGATRVRIASNTGPSGFSMMVYDDDGPNGSAGTLLDSVAVTPQQAVAGNLTIPLTAPLTIASGGVYVLWYMGGANINIAQDIVAPFSLNTYEVLGGTWAEYRDRENVDFHIGLDLTEAPIRDIGVSGFFGAAPGQNISGPTTIRTWITNHGNIAASGFSVNYRFEGEPVVTANYTGAPIAAGSQVLFSFPQQLTPSANTTGDLCAWSSWNSDMDNNNDTTCVNVNLVVGIGEATMPVLRTWPNPTRGPLQLDGLDPGPCVVQVLDARGRLVHEEACVVNLSPVTIRLDDVGAGTYQLVVKRPDTHARTTVVVLD